jgi:hypothetical protein
MQYVSRPTSTRFRPHPLYVQSVRHDGLTGYLPQHLSCFAHYSSSDGSLILLTWMITDEGAELTIIAAVGVDPHHGLPGVSRPRQPQSTLEIGGHKFLAIRNAGQEVESSRWNTRA